MARLVSPSRVLHIINGEADLQALQMDGINAKARRELLKNLRQLPDASPWLVL